jgi:hypothetical protein
MRNLRLVKTAGAASTLSSPSFISIETIQLFIIE